jgi:hypothetical protein
LKRLKHRPNVQGQPGFARSPSNQKNLFFPTSLLCDRTVSILEAVASYLHEEKGYTFRRIGGLLSRDAKTMFTSYARAKKKRARCNAEEDPARDLHQLHSVDIPLSVFHDRTLKTLEVLVTFLKEEKKLTYRQIGLVLNRDERNMWTVYHNVQKKRRKMVLEGGDRQ